MIEAFEETGLEESLPTESTVEGAESPADAYRTIYAMCLLRKSICFT